MHQLVLETTAPFQGLPELVAYDEGLFEQEGLRVSWVDRNVGVATTVDRTITSHTQVHPFTSHGKLFEQGLADMYNACEWGNYCRVQATQQRSRQIGRRAIVAYAALVVAPTSPVYTPQQLAHRTIGVPFFFGAHFITLQMLEGFLPRDLITLCSAPNGARYRLDALLKGEIEATTLTEPHVTLAEKKGCRLLASALFHGTEVASERVDAASTPTSTPISTTSSTIIRGRSRSSPPCRWRTCVKAASSCVIRHRSRSRRCNAPTSG